METKEVKDYLNDNNDCTFLVIQVKSHLHVRVYKTRNLFVKQDVLFVKEEGHPQISLNCDEMLEKETWGFSNAWCDEGKEYETRIYNIKSNLNLRAGIMFLQDIAKNIKKMLTDLEYPISMLNYEWMDRADKGECEDLMLKILSV